MPDLERLKIRKPGIIPVDLWNDAIDAISAATVTAFVGGGFFRTKAGTALMAKRSFGEGGSTEEHPFKVLQRNNGTAESPNWQWKVILESSLYKSERPNDKQTITGLDTWFEAIGNDAIWLGIVFDAAGLVTSASIDSWGQGDDFDITKDAWSGENGYCEDDGGDPPVHQTTRKLIAYSVAGDNGQPILTQKLKSDLLIYDGNKDGRPAKLVEEYSGGYPL